MSNILASLNDNGTTNTIETIADRLCWRLILRKARLTIVWLCVWMVLVASPIRTYGSLGAGKPIAPEVAAELTAYGATLVQFLQFWSPEEQEPLKDPACEGHDGKVWLGEMDPHSPLPLQVQSHIVDKYELQGVHWDHPPPCANIDLANNRIAIIAGELAKSAANYQFGLDARRGGEAKQQSAVCLPGERGKKCEFEFLDSLPERGWLSSPNTLRLKPSLSRCDLSQTVLGASCLHEQTSLLNLATFWYLAVSRVMDVRYSADEDYVEISPAERLFRVDAARRLISFQRALLPYSQWIDSKDLISELAALEISACSSPFGDGEPLDEESGCLIQARDPATDDQTEGGEEKLIDLPTHETCLKMESREDRSFTGCNLRRDFFFALRTAHLTGFFAKKLYLAEEKASMQGGAIRTQVMQLAVATAQLSPAAQSWLALGEARVNSFSEANRVFVDGLLGDKALKAQLEVSLRAKNRSSTDKNNPCTVVFDYHTYPADAGMEPPDQNYESCGTWLKESTSRTRDEVEFLHAVLLNQRKQFDTAWVMLSAAAEVAENHGLRDLNFGEKAAYGLYLKTRAAETANTLYQRLSSSTECSKRKLEATEDDQQHDTIPCQLVLPDSMKNSPSGAMRLTLQVFPVEQYSSTYNVPMSQLVEVRLTRDGCGDDVAQCYVAESETPAVVSFVRGSENKNKITAFEHHDWKLNVINVRARQIGPVDCAFSTISERSNNQRLCRPGRVPMELDQIQHWVWQRPGIPERPREWLGYLGANAFVSADGIGVVWNPDNEELQIFGTFTASTLGSSASESFSLSLTHSSESDWRRSVHQASLRAVLKALPGLNHVYQHSDSVPSSLNLPEDMVFVALSLDSVEPLRLRLYAHPKRHPALITAFTGSLDRTGTLNWSTPRALLPAKLLLFVQTADLDAMEELASVFTNTAGAAKDKNGHNGNLLGETLARRDLFDASVLNLAAVLRDSGQYESDTQLEPINVQATLNRYRTYALGLEADPAATVLKVWQKTRDNHETELDALRADLETRLEGHLAPPKIRLSGLDAKVRAELLELLNLTDWEEANELIKAQLKGLVVEVLRAFSASGALFQCWAAHQETASGVETGIDALCAPPQEAATRISTQISQIFVLGSHLNASEYNKEVKKFRDRLNKPPGPLTTQQLLDAAHGIRLSVSVDVELSVTAAWAAVIAGINRDSDDILAPLVRALKDKNKSAELLAALSEIQVNCEKSPLGCERILVSLATTSLYGEDIVLTSGLRPHLERTLSALIPRPSVVYGPADEASTKESRKLANTLTGAQSELMTKLQSAQNDYSRSIGRAVDAVGLTVRDTIAFVPPVEVREGALYLQLNSPAWGGRKGDKILGVNCQSDGTNCVASAEVLKTAADLKAALSIALPTASPPMPFIRVERASRRLTLHLPRSASYQIAIVPRIPGEAPFPSADVEQLMDSVDPRNAEAVQEKIKLAEAKYAVLTATIERLNAAVPFDWHAAYEGELEAFKKACKAATKGLLSWFGESDCEEPVTLFQKAFVDLDLRIISADIVKNIAIGATPLLRPTCVPNDEMHEVLQNAANAACGKLTEQVIFIEDELESNNLAEARAQVAALPQTVIQAFGETFADATQEEALASLMSVASAAELLPLQQTTFDYEVHSKRVCAEALESIVGDRIDGCGGLREVYVKALNLDLGAIASEQVNKKINKICVEASREIGLGGVSNCSDLKVELNQAVVAEAKKYMKEKFQLNPLDCNPRAGIDSILRGASQAACDMLRVQVKGVESAVHDTQFERAQKLTSELPRKIAEAFGDNLKQQGRRELNNSFPYWKEVQQYEHQANRLCITMRDRTADLLGDELPAVEGCKGVDAVLDPELIKDLLEKRGKELEQAARDRVEAELKARAKTLINAANAAYNEQKQLLREAAKAQAAPLLAELREAEARICRAIDILFDGGNTIELTVIAGAPFTIRRPSELGAQCLPKTLGLEAQLSLFGKDVDIIGGVTLNIDRLRDEALLDKVEAGNFNLASLVDLNWHKFRTNPSLETVLTERLRDTESGLSLQRLVARADKIEVSLQYQPAAFPFAVPVNTQISTDGVQVELGELSPVMYKAICHEIRDYILREQPEILPDARIVGAPSEYCEKREVKGLEFQVAVDLAKGIGRVDVQMFIDIETGLRIVPPDLKQLAAAQFLKLFGIDAVRPVAPFYDSTDGLTLYLEGKADTPIGLALQAGFSVSPNRLKFRGPIGLRIPGWFDTTVLSLGNLGITYNPENKELSLLGAVTVTPGAATNHLVRVDGRGSLGIEEQKLEITGNLMVLRLLGVAGTRTTISLPERLFEHTIGTSPMLADIVKLQGELRIQDLKPNPFLAGSGEGGLFGADIAMMKVELQRNLGGHFDAGLRIPLDKSAVTFKVVVEEEMGDVTAGTKAELEVGPVKPTFSMDASASSVGIGMKVKFEGAGSLDIGFALPSFASLTPEYVLSLLMDMGLTFHVPSSLATIANGAPEGYSGSRTGSGGESQGQEADSKRPEKPTDPPGNYQRAWRMVPVEYCKPFKIGFKLWCEKRIRWEPAFVDGRGGSMAQQAGYSARTAKHYDVHYNSSYKYYDLLVGAARGDKRAYAFVKDGGQLWAGQYEASTLSDLNSKPYAHKARKGENLLVVRTGDEYFGIKPNEVLDATGQSNKLNGAGRWLQDNDSGEFARRLLPSAAEAQLYNDSMVEQKPIGRSAKWVLLVITKKGGPSTPTHILAQTRGATKPLTYMALVDLNKNDGSGDTTDNLIQNLSALQKDLPDVLDRVCPPQDPAQEIGSSLSAPCAYLAVGQRTNGKPVAFGLDGTRDNRPTALLATKSQAWAAPVHWPKRFSAASLTDVDPAMLLKLLDSLVQNSAHLDGMSELTNIVIDLSANGRIAVNGLEKEGEFILFSPRNIQIDENGKPRHFEPRHLNMGCVNDFWADQGSHLRPYEETLRAQGVSEKMALMLSLIHHDVFKTYGFAADPVGSLYKRCN
ncbi:hypothetical protein [Marinobacter sp.]|uniref:hypothetical protein n=1 Tax=Marinobacter sp. TaxID=50741 RepID=UPI003A914366